MARMFYMQNNYTEIYFENGYQWLLIDMFKERSQYN